jgi:nucleoside 2-deoxyribosyltransferase
MGEGEITELRLKEKCFVPDRIFNFTYNELLSNGYLNINDGSLTSTGNAFYKNEIIEEFPKNYLSKTIFIAQAFRPELERNFKEILEPLIREKFKLIPVKINDTDPDEPVDVAILNQIDLSRFVICDLTFARPSVYFEAGYAIAKGIKVIFTAREDHNSDHPKFGDRDNIDYKIHFDLRNRQITFWDEKNLSAFEDELYQRVHHYLEQQKKSLE